MFVRKWTDALPYVLQCFCMVSTTGLRETAACSGISGLGELLQLVMAGEKTCDADEGEVHERYCKLLLLNRSAQESSSTNAEILFT